MRLRDNNVSLQFSLNNKVLRKYVPAVQNRRRVSMWVIPHKNNRLREDQQSVRVASSHIRGGGES
jgi:hypothetical protein